MFKKMLSHTLLRNMILKKNPGYAPLTEFATQFNGYSMANDPSLQQV